MEHPQIMKPLRFAILAAALTFTAAAHAQNTQPAYTATPEMKLFPTPTPAAAKPKPQPALNGNSLNTAQIQALQAQQAQQNQQTTDSQQQTAQTAAPMNPALNATLDGVLSPEVFQTLSPAVQQALKAAGQAPKSNGK